MTNLQMDVIGEKPATSYKTYMFVVVFASTLTLYVLYDQTIERQQPSNVITTEDYPYLDSKYLVWSSKCRIPNLNPLNDEVKNLFKARSYSKCTKKPLLTYTKVINNTGFLYIDKHVEKQYTKNGIICCYSTVIRENSKLNPDSKITTSSCNRFQNNVTLPEDIIFVKCKDNSTGEVVYRNVHAVITIHESVRKKISAIPKENHLSILCIGIDSVSRLNLMRAMPKTRSFLEKNNWLELKGYNKVADNTFPNLMGILTGMNETEAFSTCNPKRIGYLDRCKILWYDYRDLGYVTGYAEDDGDINTFNYNKKGFSKPPTDYYFRPYILATEHYLSTSKVDEMMYCTGPETAGERILHVGKSFIERFKNHPYFGFFWMNTFSHNKLYAVSRMDQKVYEFLQDIWKTDVLNNTVVFFFSDHGLRFGSIRYTTSGWLEERLPFFFVAFPKWFPDAYPEKYANFIRNSNRLTNPYDFYMTLQDLLVMEGKNYTVKQSSACSKCKSLFEPMEINRSCEDASITPHWCTCGGYSKISSKNATVVAAVDYIIKKIHHIIDSHHDTSNVCAKYKLKKVISSSISENGANWYKKDTYLLIVIQTIPEAVFEATVSIEIKNSFKMQGGISRLDSYQRHSDCINDSYLKKYCYCTR